jgi:hypothetical protein
VGQFAIWWHVSGMPKTYSVPHYVLVFNTGTPKTKRFDDKEEVKRFLATAKRAVAEYKVNGTKQAQSSLNTIQGIAKREYGEKQKRDFSQIALSVVEKDTGNSLISPPGAKAKSN